MAIETTVQEAREVWAEVCEARNAERSARAAMIAASAAVEKVGTDADLAWVEASVARDNATRRFFEACDAVKSAEHAWGIVCESVEAHMCFDA